MVGLDLLVCPPRPAYASGYSRPFWSPVIVICLLACDACVVAVMAARPSSPFAIPPSCLQTRPWRSRQASLAATRLPRLYSLVHRLRLCRSSCLPAPSRSRPFARLPGTLLVVYEYSLLCSLSLPPAISLAAYTLPVRGRKKTNDEAALCEPRGARGEKN